MELEGKFVIADSLAEYIRELARQTMSGTLRIQMTGNVIQLHFSLGKITGSDNQLRPRLLGNILLGRGLIDRAGLEEALAYQNDFAPSTPLGKVLLFRDRITQADLREALKLQVEEELWDLFGGDPGSYTFQERGSASFESPLVELDTTALVDLVIHRRGEWKNLQDHFPNENVIPSVIKIQSASDRETLHFTEREWQVLSLVNSYYDIGCITARSGLGRFETYKILNTLLSTGMIKIRQSDTPVTGMPALETNPSLTPEERGGPTPSTRWSGILARIKETDDSHSADADDQTPMHFPSPVSFLVAIANKLLASLADQPGFITTPEDSQLIEKLWRQALMSSPKADLVSTSPNSLDAEDFDRYIRTLGVQGPMKSIYLETMEALGKLLRTLYLLADQRLGTRTARSLFANTLENMRQRSTMDNGDLFFFKEFASRILE